MKLSTTRRLAVLVVILSIVAAACGDSDTGTTSGEGQTTTTGAPGATTTTTAATTTTAGPPEIVKIKAGIAGGTPLDITAQYMLYAQEEGFYAAHGVEVEMVLLADDQLSMRGLAAGEFDVTLTGCNAIMTATEVGAPFKVLGGVNDRLDYSLVATTEIGSPKDLVGNSLGVSSPGAISFAVPKLLIETDGGNFDDVDVVAVGGSSARTQALLNGNIDGGVVSAIWVPQLLERENLHVIATAAELDLLFSCFPTSEKVLEEKRDALVGFMAANLEAVQWAKDNEAAAVAHSQVNFAELEPATVAAAIASYNQNSYWNATSCVSPSAWAFTSETLVEGGDLVEPVLYEDVVLTDVCEEANSMATG